MTNRLGLGVVGFALEAVGLVMEFALAAWLIGACLHTAVF
jgi:hypothetical protein